MLEELAPAALVPPSARKCRESQDSRSRSCQLYDAIEINTGVPALDLTIAPGLGCPVDLVQVRHRRGRHPRPLHGQIRPDHGAAMSDDTPSPLNNIITMSGSRATSTGWCAGPWRKRGTPCSMPRQIGRAMRNGMSAARRVAIPALATMSAACRPRFRNCAGRRAWLRLATSSSTRFGAASPTQLCEKFRTSSKSPRGPVCLAAGNPSPAGASDRVERRVDDPLQPHVWDVLAKVKRPQFSTTLCQRIIPRISPTFDLG
jgi:hypothetical protein